MRHAEKQNLLRILEAGAFSPFETACMVNLLPENAEEAKALIPSLAVSSQKASCRQFYDHLQEVELVYSLQKLCLSTTWANVMHCSAHSMAVYLYGGLNSLSGFKIQAMLLFL